MLKFFTSKPLVIDDVTYDRFGIRKFYPHQESELIAFLGKYATDSTTDMYVKFCMTTTEQYEEMTKQQFSPRRDGILISYLVVRDGVPYMKTED